jgi:hypothetical protein
MEGDTVLGEAVGDTVGDTVVGEMSGCVRQRFDEASTVERTIDDAIRTTPLFAIHRDRFLFS